MKIVYSSELDKGVKLVLEDKGVVIVGTKGVVYIENKLVVNS